MPRDSQHLLPAADATTWLVGPLKLPGAASVPVYVGKLRSAV